MKNTKITEENNILILDRRGDDRKIEFLGVNFAPISPEDLLARIVEKADAKEEFGYLVTPNTDHLVRLNADESLQTLYEDAWLNVCDSRIIEVLAKFSEIKMPACPGSDLAASLFEREIKKDEEITIIGADKQIIDALGAKYGLTNIKWHEPPMGLKNNPEAINAAAEFIAQSQSRFHFICVGSPQQEMVARAVLQHKAAKGVGLCLGASLDFLAGRAERAPIWMQKSRLEWLHRLISEPKRMWKRYLIEGPKIFTIWLGWQADHSRKNNLR